MVEFPTFRGFAEKTKLHGIPRTAEGSKGTKAFWGVLTVICISMAIRDLYTLITNYQAGDTAISVSLGKNDSFAWPTPTLCMEMLVDYVDHSNSISVGPSNNMNSQSDLLQWQLDLKGHNLDQVVNNLVAFYNSFSNDNYTSINYVDGAEDSNVMYYPYMMLGYLIDLEQQLIGQNRSQLRNNQLNLAKNDPLHGNRLQMFFDRFTQKGMSMVKLTQLVGMWYCRKQFGDPNDPIFNQSIYENFENYRYFGDPNYVALPLCRHDLITYVGFSMVCTKLQFQFQPAYNTFAIYDTQMSQPQSFIDLGRGMMMPDATSAKLIPNLRFHFDLQGRNVVPADDDTNVFSWNPSQDVVLDISVSEEYQFLNTKKKSCSNAPISQSQCIWNKRVAFVYQQCGCWPRLVDITNLNNSISACPVNIPTSIVNLTMAQYCNINQVDFNQLDTSDCIPDCHLFTYGFTKQLSSIFPWGIFTREWGVSGQRSGFKLGTFEFRFTSADYNLVTERFTTDWNNFLGTWGGSIGTWLGASLLAFIHIPVYIIRQFRFPKTKSAAAE